jgi:hypothetical protein
MAAIFPGVSMRSFDARLVGTVECRAWETYYRRKWAAFLVASVRLVRGAFGMPWPATLKGAWLVLRANQKWAPVPDNDPAAARRLMADFYRLLIANQPSLFDPERAAELEVEWWRVHRARQQAPQQRRGSATPRGGGQESFDSLVDALVAVYEHVYGADPGELRRAAELRAEAMDVSDAWVAAGCDPADPQLARERALLVRSYAALLAAVHQ